MPRLPLRILVVDDNRSSASALARLLSRDGDSVQAVFDGQSAIARIREEPPDVVLTDLRMEPVNGLSVLQAAKAVRPAPEVIVFTAHGEVDTAVRAMRMGALDFLTKPVTLEQLRSRLDRVRGVEEESATLPDFVAESDSSRALVQVLKRAAVVPSPVWIEGQYGTGRTFCARTLHNLGPELPIEVRDPARDDPWPTLPGTLVLPEIDRLDADGQWRLARHLQGCPPDLRVIATAQPDASARVSRGDLLPELYYRLAVVVVRVPPLRERGDDIVPLFHSGLQRYAARYGLPVPPIPAELADRLTHHQWPGNVRELLNLAERTVVLGSHAVELPARPKRSAVDRGPVLREGFSLSRHLEEVEKRILQEALRKAGNDRAKARRLLGLERNTLKYKLKKYELL